MVTSADYEARQEAARQAFPARARLDRLFDPALEPEILELFLIRYCAWGVAMTEPVEGWIRRAGERCIAAGFAELGAALVRHAAHEAGHHELMVGDTRRLVARWNERHPTPLDADAILAAPIPPGVVRYRELHEETIAGPAPFGQLAIEYEIERLPGAYGGRLLAHCAERLGKDVLSHLSFIEEHVALDTGHTHYNAAELGRLLAAHPETLEPLVEAGRAALEAYADFFSDCLGAASAMRVRST